MLLQFAVKGDKKAMADTQQLPVMVLQAPPKGFRNDKRKDGWTLESDCGSVVGEPILTLNEFLEEGESYVRGDVMVARAKEMPGGPTGQSHAERMLEQQHRIPLVWRLIEPVFTDTVWLDQNGYRYVACLKMGIVWWELNFHSLSSDFYSYCRVVRLRPNTNA